ncbi:L-rhamnose mutarotase [Pedobacter panaciterrae]|uniref:L-rhamnose mutarotase n=1 Tax=Pedobacter panaciterrae TaxID=363849 RepID=A0ABU8NPT2_9SPHI
MKKKILQLASIIFTCSFIMCSPANSDKESALVEKVFVVNTVDNDKKLNEYLAYHKQIWPEVEAGFKKAGYKSITLYHFNDLIVMTIMVPENADLNEMGKLAESYSPRCAEWNKLMNTYQKGVNGTSEGQKWVEVIPFYKFKQ